MTKELKPTDVQNVVALSAIQLTQDKAQTYELVGMLKMSSFTRKLVSVTEIKLLAELKESKRYKELTINNTRGESVTCSTFKEFCEALGASYEKVNLDIQNLNILGEDFLETSQRIGLGYRELRKLRKLPEEERELIINGEVLKIQDKEDLVELIEERALAHAKEKDALQKQLADAQADGEAKTKVIADKDKKINELSTAFEKKKLQLESLPPEQVALELFQNTWGEAFGKLRAATYQVQQTANQAIENEDLPFTFHQKLTLDIVEMRDMLNELLELLPSDTEPVDTSWLEGEQV